MSNIKLFSFIFLFFTFIQSKAEIVEATQETGGSESNYVLIAMATLALVLILVIFVLAGVLKAAVKSKMSDLIKGKQATLILLALFVSSPAMAQDKVASGLYEATPIAGMHPMVFYSLFAVLLIEIFVILWMCLIILRLLIKPRSRPVEQTSTMQKSSFFTRFISRKIFGVAPVESDKDVMLDHEYDGIRELDNDLPPWWKYGFYLTILSAIIYFTSYHITHTSLSSIEEYELEMKEAEASIAAYRSEKALNVDETNAVFVKEVEKINEGKALYVKNCAVCHGNEGQGLVGPNFADHYWIYGNKPGNLFGIVKNGTAKGMKAWKDELSPVEIQNVISYIHTFQGSNPAMPKAAEGELYEENIANESPSNGLAGDSLKNLEIKE